MRSITRKFHDFATKTTSKEKANSTILILLILIITTVYYLFSLNNIITNQETNAIELANSTAALIFSEHIIENEEEYLNGNLTASPMTGALDYFVESTDKVYYAFVLKNIDKKPQLIANSAAIDLDIDQDLAELIVNSQESIYQVFIGERAVITPKNSSASGSWVHVLTPAYYQDDHLYAVFGTTYSWTEWRNNIYTQMLPTILIILMVWALVFTTMVIRFRQKQLLHYTAELKESERSKSLYLSQIAGMAYRCKNDPDWTMEFVSQGCYDLTGYPTTSLIGNKDISYNALISPEYQVVLHQEWNRILARHTNFTGEYQIITKDGELKWVMEYGQGVYNKDGSVEALEGIIFDITDRKKSEMQLNYLQEHDILTGLYNRSHMEQELKQIKSAEYLPLTIMILDIDGLRMINCAYGHNVGNHVITASAKLIKLHMGKDVIVANMGAGEFMALLPNTDQIVAEKIKRNIKADVQKHNLESEFASHQFNLSIAYETRENMDITIEEIVALVEENLKKHKLLNQHSTYSAIVSSIMATLYAKSHETESHGLRLGKFSTMIGEKLGLKQNELDDLRLLAQLHDIGKIGIHDRILNKPAALTKEEWAIMKQHPQIGFEIVSAIPQISHIADYILAHHERWDGAGYPSRLAGEEIPFISRVLAVADAYDAMIEDRVYRKALTREEALAEIKGGAGTQFDPKVAAVFVQLFEEGRLSF